MYVRIFVQEFSTNPTYIKVVENSLGSDVNGTYVQFNHLNEAEYCQTSDAL